MPLSKINAFYTGKVPLSQRFRKIIYPQLAQVMPVCSRQVIPLTDCASDDSCFNVEPEFYSLDYRHWYYDEDVFEKYIEKIITYKPKRLFIFDNPFDHERPWTIDIRTFSRRLNQRARKLVEIIRKESPETMTIASWISVVEDAVRTTYVKFVGSHIDLFDAYSVLCVNDMTDISLGLVSSTLFELRRIEQKPTFLLCAVPAGKIESQSKRGVQQAVFEPMVEQDASQRLKQIFELFKNITQNEFYMLYLGIDRDAYDPNKKSVPDDFWQNSIPIDMYIHEYKWDWFHFLGLLNYNDRVKSYLLKALIGLSKKENENGKKEN